MEMGFFLGCNMPAIRPDLERAIRATMPELGVDLVDMEGYVCCPAFGSFPSTDDESHLAASGWNLSIAEEKDVDILVECGSCYSSLNMGRHHLIHDEKKLCRVNKLLEPTGRSVSGKAKVRHISDVLYNEVGTDTITQALKHTLEGFHAVIQYPCHTLYPSEILGFEKEARKPVALEKLTQALGAEVDHFSREHTCCGGAGGFTNNSPAEANAFIQETLDAIIEETKADFIVTSCITCLMHLDNVQKTLNQQIGEERYTIPVFDYSQILALCMGKDPKQVACISTMPRDAIIDRF
jgi:heterodisulfide reductase subunit B